MGNNGSEPFSYAYELPQHDVLLSSYYISVTEVPISGYVQFLNAGGNDDHWRSQMTSTTFCGILQSGSPGSYTYSVATDRGNYPVTYVTWNDATHFCDWMTMTYTGTWRLPTEAEWEKAARWVAATSTARVYPWGNSWDCNALNNGYAACVRIFRPNVVGSYPTGISPYGLLDMAGNVAEWVSDYYSATYYQSSPSENPTGPTTGTNRVVRGGSFLNGLDETRCAARQNFSPTSVLNSVGFRVVRVP